MVVFTNLQQVSLCSEATVLTVGNFDGVHKGHEHLLLQMKKEATENNAKTVVLSFAPHPQKVLSPESGFQYVQTKKDLIICLETLGIDYLFFIPFSNAIANLSPNEFFNKFIWEKFLPKSILIGNDFAFGKGRSGNIQVLQDLAKKYSFDLQVIPKVSLAKDEYSSSSLRKYLSQPDLKLYKEFTGRDYFVTGLVVSGEGRGKSLGFPTVNLSIDRKISLSHGVYITHLHYNGKALPAITNVGVNPTFSNDNSPVKIETHSLQEIGDLYGKNISVQFLKHLRDEQKFSGPKQLVEQIEKDKRQAIEYFNKYEMGGNSSK